MLEKPECPGAVGAAANRDGSRSVELDAALELEVKRTNGFSPEVAAAMEAARDPAYTAGRLAALREFVAHAVEGADIPDEMLRREHLYGDRGR